MTKILVSPWLRRYCNWAVRIFPVAGLFALQGCGTLPAARDPDLQAQCRLDMKYTEQLRGLSLKQDIAIERESPIKLTQSLAAELDKPENQVFLANSSELLKQLHVIGMDEDLKALYLKVMGQQVAAYYDPEKKRVAYIEGAEKAFATNSALPLVERFVYVHEFCHAVEDSHFDIEKLTRESLTDFDRNMALTSLIEGDAVLVGLDSMFCEAPVNTATPLGAFAVHVMGCVDMSDEVKTMGDCPAFLSGALLRPYLDGGVFSNRIRREAGWTAIDAVFSNRVPKTTAEILYPERRFLRVFRPAVFRPDNALFCSAFSGVQTNRVGAMGIAMWLSNTELVQRNDYGGFLKGWVGDQIYFLKGSSGDVIQTIWLSNWERADQARTFCRKAEQRMRSTFKDVSWSASRKGHLVAIVWSKDCNNSVCKNIVDLALKTQVETNFSGGFCSWCNDCPWPLRFSDFEDYSQVFEVLGGHGADTVVGKDFWGVNLVDGLIFRIENNADRHYWGMLGGLVQHVSDRRSNFTFWRVPVVASWFRRGLADKKQFSWSVLCGLAAYGDENKAAVLFIPVWRATLAQKK